MLVMLIFFVFGGSPLFSCKFNPNIPNARHEGHGIDTAPAFALVPTSFSGRLLPARGSLSAFSLCGRDAATPSRLYNRRDNRMFSAKKLSRNIFLQIMFFTFVSSSISAFRPDHRSSDDYECREFFKYILS